MAMPIETEIATAGTVTEIALALEHLLSGGYGVRDDRLTVIRAALARIHGLKISVYAKEHPPPHFHVTGGGLDVSFSILDGSLLTGKIDGRRMELITYWYKRSRGVLVDFWNKTRPTDSPVGPISV